MQENDIMKQELLLHLFIIVIEKSVELDNINKKDEYKYQVTIHVAENSHIALFCPESAPESNIRWYKDKKLVNSSYRNNMAESKDEPHITIDSFNSLQLLHITRSEEGIYTCTNNGKILQEWVVKVVSEKKILHQEFIRYSIYLGFILSLTVTCYCAGVCVAWHRKDFFMDPLSLNAKRNYSLQNY